MKINKKFGDSIYLEWIDACEVCGWKSYDEALKVPDECYCKTRAFFLGQNKEFVSIVHTIGKDVKNDITGILHIPKAWLKKVK